MKIAILDDYQNAVPALDCFSMLSGQDVVVFNNTEKNIERLAERLQGVEILVLIRERSIISDELLSLLPNLKLISQTGKISNHLDLAACTKHSIAVAEGVGSPIAPAELTWALLLNTVRKIPQAIDGIKAGNWQVNIGSSVHGKTIGIWGYGKIGQRIAGYANAFGAKVLVWGSQASREKAVADGYESASDIVMFFSTSDVVTLHLRLTPETTGIVKQSHLQRMKTSAAFINTARAELVKKGALVEALRSGNPGFAGVDVYQEEPVNILDEELLSMPNVVCTPHLGYVEKGGYELYFSKAFENIIRYINGNPVNIANPQVLNTLKI